MVAVICASVGDIWICGRGMRTARETHAKEKRKFIQMMTLRRISELRELHNDECRVLFRLMTQYLGFLFVERKIINIISWTHISLGTNYKCSQRGLFYKKELIKNYIYN